MAGRDSSSPEGSSAEGAGAPSLPLYLAGGVVAACGILAADYALTQPDYGWVTTMLMLSGLGLLFSYGCRRLGIGSRALDLGFAAVLLALLAGIASRRIAPEQFLPAGADSNSLRLLAGLVWGGAVWCWALGSDNRVMASSVPAMAALGMAATVDVNTPVVVCFGVFILAVIFLLIHQNFLQNRGRAEPSSADVPRRLLLAQLAQSGVAGLGVLLAGSLVIIPAQAAFSHLSLAQALRHLAAIRPAALGGADAAMRFSDDDDLPIGTGTAWSASPEVLMRVTPSDGQPHLWRGRTYDLYTGGGWQSSLENAFADRTQAGAASGGRLSYAVPPGLTPGDAPPGAASGPLLTATFEARGDTSQFYYAAVPRQVVFGAFSIQDRLGVRAWRDGKLGLTGGGPIRFPYQVISEAAPDPQAPEVQDRLRRAGAQYPAEIRRLYLGQSPALRPEDLAAYRQAVAAALGGLPPDRRNPLDEALALRDWVSRRCVYTLVPPPLPDDADHVRAFLFDTRRGYCDLFASSLAVLCRTEGIPARLATGFAPGDPDGPAFNLRAEDKHAWTEVYFPGAGWVALDATSGSATDGTVPASQAGVRGGWLGRLRAGLAAAGGVVYPLLGIVLALVGYVLKTEVYDRRRARAGYGPAAPNKPQAPRTALGLQYTRLCRALARLGLPRRAAETPGEYAGRVLPLLPALEREWGVSLPASAVSGVSRAFVRACYGDPAAPPASLDGPAGSWEAAVSQLDAAARRVQQRRFWWRVTRPRLARPAGPSSARQSSLAGQ